MTTSKFYSLLKNRVYRVKLKMAFMVSRSIETSAFFNLKIQRPLFWMEWFSISHQRLLSRVRISQFQVYDWNHETCLKTSSPTEEQLIKPTFPHHPKRGCSIPNWTSPPLADQSKVHTVHRKLSRSAISLNLAWHWIAIYYLRSNVKSLWLAES